MSDYIKITNFTDSYNLTNTYNVDSFLLTPTWLDGGYLASVEVEFQCNTVIKKIGRAIAPIDGGDFNNDYNDDFKIS